MALWNRVKEAVKPPKKREIDEELAGPGMGSVRQIQSGHPADGLEPHRLGQILREAETGDATAYLELAEQMEEKDLHYAAVLGVRKRAIRALELTVTAGGEEDIDEEAAQFVREQLSSDIVRSQLTDMLDAVGKGYSVHEIMWDYGTNKWTIGRLKYRDPRWFRFDREDGETLRIRDNAGDIDMPPGRFLTHCSKMKSGTPIRGGLARLVVWGYMFKNYSLKDWAIFLEAFGHPIRLGQYGPNASDTDKRALLRAVRMIGTDMAAIIPKSMDVEIINGNVTGAGPLFEGSARYWDEQLSKAALGQVGTTDAIAGGHAVGKVQNEVREDIRDADAEELATTLGMQLVLPLTRWNYGDNVALPKVAFVAPEEHDPRLVLTAIKELMPLGLEVSHGFAREKFGIREPQEGEELLTAPARAPGGGVDPSTLPNPRTASAAGRFDETGNSLDGLLAETMQRYSAARSDPMIDGLMEALEGARSLEEMRGILEQLANEAPDATLKEFLTNVMLVARLAGESGAELT
jgi:phage gp29-like protein